ncbi:MAG: ABC transporter ATP-binding protein, partial [Planctomycetota bacterium]|nr:ABC transporter ATP-binding protein [Planctomycetota bacterium]
MSARLAPPDLALSRRVKGAEEEEEAKQRPLQFSLIVRLYRYTHACARIRNILFFLVVLRSLQLPALAWLISATIEGPIHRGDFTATLWYAAGFAALAAFTQGTLVFRQRLALNLGESVVYQPVSYTHL